MPRLTSTLDTGDYGIAHKAQKASSRSRSRRRQQLTGKDERRRAAGGVDERLCQVVRVKRSGAIKVRFVRTGKEAVVSAADFCTLSDTQAMHELRMMLRRKIMRGIVQEEMNSARLQNEARHCRPAHRRDTA